MATAVYQGPWVAHGGANARLKGVRPLLLVQLDRIEGDKAFNDVGSLKSKTECER